MFYLPIIYCCFLSLLSGPIGCLILWSRLTFFGETIAHAGVLGLFISLYFHTSLTVSMGFIVFFYCISLEFLTDRKSKENTLLPIFSYGVLGLGLVLIEQLTPTSSALFSVLLGDLLLVQAKDLISLILTTSIVWALWLRYKDMFVLSLIMPELAQIRGMNLCLIRFLSTLCAGLAIAFVIHATGMLLAMALLTIPPLAARSISATPEQMIWRTCALSALSLALGFTHGIIFDISLGPAMSTSALGVFLAIKILMNAQVIIAAKKVSSLK